MHSEADAYNDPFDGLKKAKEQMAWLVKKGDGIFSNVAKRASITLSRKFGRKDPRMFKTFIVTSTDEKAPQRFADVSRGVTSSNWALVEFNSDADLETRTVTAIEYDFTDILENKLTHIKGIVQGWGRRNSYFLVHFEIQIEVEMEWFQVWVTCNGEERRRIVEVFGGDHNQGM